MLDIKNRMKNSIGGLTMVYLCGDIHGTLDIQKLIDFFETEKPDTIEDRFLIILGDTAICWDDGQHDRKVRDILSALPVSAVLFIDGNHENFDLLEEYPLVKWNGGLVHEIDSGIFHLIRGQVYEIDGKTFFTFGGACSTDKDRRRRGINWWPEERPCEEEYERGLEALEANSFSVDYILTHTAPREVVYELGGDDCQDENELRNYLQKIADWTDFIAWYFGHFHVDESIDDIFFCVMDEIIKLP